MKVQRLVCLSWEVNEALKKAQINVSELINTLLNDWVLKKEEKLQSVTQIVTAKELEIQQKTKEVEDLKALEAKREAILKIVPVNVADWLYKWRQFHTEAPSMNECNAFRQSHDIKFHLVTTDMIWKAWAVLNG